MRGRAICTARRGRSSGKTAGYSRTTCRPSLICPGSVPIPLRQFSASRLTRIRQSWTATWSECWRAFCASMCHRGPERAERCFANWRRICLPAARRGFITRLSWNSELWSAGRANPICSSCPLQSLCRAALDGQQQEYPKKLPRRPRPHRLVAVGWSGKGHGC